MENPEYHIQHEPARTSGHFKLIAGGEEAGSLHYTLFGNGRLVIQHTEVARELQGTGASHALLDEAVNYARHQKMKVVPVCPFAKKVMTYKREKYGDVLA